jgi:uncharacterized protein YegL
MRRLPIYFLIDVSESMVGEPIAQVEDGMRSIIQELRTDPYALETVYVSVIAFAGKAKSLSPLTELNMFYPPKMPVGGGTAIGAALDYLMDDIDKSVQRTTADFKGDWKPIVFLFTDGTATDKPDKAIERWRQKYMSRCSMVCISIGENGDTAMLGKLTENVLRLNSTDVVSFKAFFKWVTASIKTSSMSVSDRGIDDICLAPTEGINLEKVDTRAATRIDENFAVLPARCSNTKKMYLIKYAKKTSEIEGLGELGFNPNYFRLVGAYPVDEATYEGMSNGKSSHKINTTMLQGVPTCPCCGNQYGFVVCECGNIMCHDGMRQVCPWCGTEGILTEGSGEGSNVGQGQG